MTGWATQSWAMEGPMATKCKISLALVVVVGFLHCWLANWASLFAGWMQKVLDDERSNAFSLFVHNETCRVFHGTVALQVPGA